MTTSRAPRAQNRIYGKIIFGLRDNQQILIKPPALPTD
jgi:hypothetical protein